MELDLFCDKCSATFDEDERLPLVLERWGHTICRKCIQYIKRKHQVINNSGTKMCNIWDEPQENPDNLAVNKMLLKAISKL